MLLSLKQVAERLRVKEKTVRGFVRCGRLRVRQLGLNPQYRVEDGELVRFMTEESWTPEDITPFIRHNIPGMYKPA